jgi:heme exporter protein D
MDLGPHAAFIWASYAAFIVIVGLLIGWTLYDGRRQANALAEADRRGLKRRSADGASRGNP